MKTFKYRITNLLEKTTNDVIRKEANTILHMIEQGGDATNLLKVLVEKIEAMDINTLTDVDKKFVFNERHLELLETLELKQIFNTLQMNPDVLKANPQLSYIIASLHSTYETKQQPAVFVAESLLNVLSKFTYLPVVDQQYQKLAKIINENQEDLLVLKTIISLDKINQDFYKDLIESLKYYIYDKESITRSQIFEKFKKYEFEPAIKEFLTQFSKFSAQDGLTIVNENKNFKVKPVYSFIRIDETNKNKIIFAAAGNYYEKYNNKITKLNEAQIALLPDIFIKINNFLNNKNITINENSLNIFLDSNKISIKSTDDNKVEMYLNENLIKFSNPYQFLMQSGAFKFEEADQLELINQVYENFNSLVNIDFAKAIVSNINENFGAVIFKLDDPIEDEKFYVHLINPAMGINEFKDNNINAVQLRNKLLEFMNYDVSDSLYEFMSNTYNEIDNLKKEQMKINEEIQELNAQLIKVEQAELDPLTGNEIKELNLKEAISKEISALKAEWLMFENRINKLQTITESEEQINKLDNNKIIPNKQVKIKNSGIIGKIISVNTITKEVSVLTNEGDTINCPFDQIELIEDTIAKNAEELQKQAKEVANIVQTESIDNESNKIPKTFLGYPLKKRISKISNTTSDISEGIIPQGEDEFTGYGVKDDKKAKGNERSEIEGVKDPNQKFTQEDKKILMDIDLKVTRSIDVLNELENFLEQYTKLNKKPISSIINQLKSYKESIVNELSKL